MNHFAAPLARFDGPLLYDLLAAKISGRQVDRPGQSCSLTRRSGASAGAGCEFSGISAAGLGKGRGSRENSTAAAAIPMRRMALPSARESLWALQAVRAGRDARSGGRYRSHAGGALLALSSACAQAPSRAQRRMQAGRTREFYPRRESAAATRNTDTLKKNPGRNPSRYQRFAARSELVATRPPVSTSIW